MTPKDPLRINARDLKNPIIGYQQMTTQVLKSRSSYHIQLIGFTESAQKFHYKKRTSLSINCEPLLMQFFLELTGGFYERMEFEKKVFVP